MFTLILTISLIIVFGAFELNYQFNTKLNNKQQRLFLSKIRSKLDTLSFAFAVTIVGLPLTLICLLLIEIIDTKVDLIPNY